MVLAVALVAGLSALVAAFVVPVWIFAALVVVRSTVVPDFSVPLVSAPRVRAFSLRGPPIPSTF